MRPAVQRAFCIDRLPPAAYTKTNCTKRGDGNGHTFQKQTGSGRYALLDELRGLDLLSMIGYHACWDLIFLFGMSAAWYTGWQGHLWQQSICWVFILLSGFCLPLGIAHCGAG